MMNILIIAAVLFSNNPREIATINKYKKEAEQAYATGDFGTAIDRYRYLVDSMDIGEDEVLLNLAHAYYQKNDTANARDFYARASMSGNDELKSIAYQQLGVMAKSPQTLPQALQYLKASLKSNPDNEGARYDFELVKKLMQEQQEQQQDQQNQDQNQNKEDQENQDQQDQQDQQNQDNQENQDQQGEQDQQQQQQDKEKKDGEQEEQQTEEGEEQQKDQEQEMSTKEKLEQMNISPEKAQMILEAMRNGEIQYLQQQKRKATKRPESGKPDWR